MLSRSIRGSFHAIRSTCTVRRTRMSSTSSFKSGAHYPYGPVGVARALQDTSQTPSTPTLFRKEFSLADRVALVTGANSGLGLESALALIEAGARAVYCVDIAAQPSPEWTKVKEFASRMQGTGGEGRLEYVNASVCDQERFLKVGESIGDKEGRLDICVASAGIIGDGAQGLDITAGAFDEVLSVNLKGVLYAAQAAGKQMVRFNSPGSIIFMASVLGSVACMLTEPGSTSYAVAKGGVLQMTRSLAVELAPKGIRVNSISPGFMRTNMISGILGISSAEAALGKLGPMGRIGEPHELRGAVTWLASDASSFCTGSDIFVSGGHQAW
ncbi:sorbose reductase sou1 [Cubamyces lactineus]|nr:sorbose reductase sou1 [Cubamyces lactineus]